MYVPITDGHDNPRFLKDDVVQGYKTYVLRDIVDKDGSYEDGYYAPGLDGYPIKTVKFAPYGNSVTEAIKIILGDPDDKVFASPASWLVDYDHFKAKIKALDDDGKHEAAEAMRLELQQRLAKEIKDQ